MKLVVELEDDEAMALAEWCKRSTYEDLRRRAADQAEYDAMDRAFIKVRRSLNESGYDPR